MLTYSLLYCLAGLLSLVTAIWPVPHSFEAGNSILTIDHTFNVTLNGLALQTRSSASEHSWIDSGVQVQVQLVSLSNTEPVSLTSEDIVQATVSRTLNNIFHRNIVPWKLQSRSELAQTESHTATSDSLHTLDITITNTTNQPLFGDNIDESYTLSVSKDGHASLHACSATGVIRGLETFAQLFYLHSDRKTVYMTTAPLFISDVPRYSHRGVMLDVARNYYPVDDIKRTIDALSWNKMNKLHIHVTDSQSWPLEIPTMPELSEKGAYSADSTYTAQDIEALQQYGIARGVEVYFEIDMPGHIGSVSHSHPELITAFDAQPYTWWCAEPPCGAFRLNDTNVATFLEALLGDLLPRISPYSSYFSTGGDELNANDSILDPGLKTNNTKVLQPLLQTFVDNQHARVRNANMTPAVWEEIPLTWNVTLGNDTVVQSWLGASSVASLTAKGHRVIDSNYNAYYLDCGRSQWLTFDNGPAFQQFYTSGFVDWCSPVKSWQVIYAHDPAANLPENQAKLVLGGEVAIWSESIDAVNLDSLLWPRGSAAAETLWSGRTNANGRNRSQVMAAPRLNEMRERMVARGVGASPVQMIWCSQNGLEACAQPV